MRIPSDYRRTAAIGLSLGLGTAGIASYLNYLKDLKRQQQLYADTSFDDDTLFVKKKKPQNKKASEDINWENPLGLGRHPNDAARTLAFLGSSAAGYYGLRRLFKDQKKKRLQKELDNLQVAYYGDLINKKASTSPLISWQSSPWLAAALVTMGTAGLIPKFLDKQFPAPKTSDPVRRPKRIEIIEEDEEDTESELYKESSINDIEYENLFRTVLADKNVAKISGFNDVVNYIANGNIKKAEQLICQDPEQLFKAASNASEGTEFRRQMAITYMSTHPTFQEVLGPYAAAEVFEMSPVIVKTAHELDPEFLGLCRDAVNVVTYNIRSNVYSKLNDVINSNGAMEKYASEVQKENSLFDQIYKTATTRQFLGYCLENSKSDDDVLIKAAEFIKS